LVAIDAAPSEVADDPQEGHGYLGSLMAVCLALLLQCASLHGGAPAEFGRVTKMAAA